MVSARSPMSTTRPDASGPKIDRVALSTRIVSGRASSPSWRSTLGGAKTCALWVEADHEQIRPHPALAALPFRQAEIDRGRRRDIGRGAHPVKPAQRERTRLRLILVLVGDQQQIETQIVVEQHSPLRHRIEQAQLDEHQHDCHEDADQRQRRPPLLMGQDPPGEQNIHSRLSSQSYRRWRTGMILPRYGAQGWCLFLRTGIRAGPGEISPGRSSMAARWPRCCTAAVGAAANAGCRQPVSDTRPDPDPGRVG